MELKVITPDFSNQKSKEDPETEKRREELAQYIEEMVAKFREGEIENFSLIYTIDERVISLTSFQSRVQMMGALEVAKGEVVNA